MLLDLVTPLHERTERDYVKRLKDDKIACMKEARKFEKNYWDGERRFGYGGYKYDGRWKVVAEKLIENYAPRSVLDVGCGKGHLLYELQKLDPTLKLAGIDRSLYALANQPKELKADTSYARCQYGLEFGEREFDLVISLGTLHNLTLSELWRTLPDIQRVGRSAYIMVESFRDEKEWFNLTAWCLTAETIMRPEDWCFLYDKCGYKGDYEFIYFC